jgi:putative transposase
MKNRRYRVITKNSEPYFITCTIVNWLPLFEQAKILDILVNSLQHMQKNCRLTLYAYVIMKNHLHLIASSKNLSNEMAAFKSYTARCSIDWLKSIEMIDTLRLLKKYKKTYKHDQEFQFWVEGFHPKLIFNDSVFKQKLNYIHQNPVKAGYVDTPEDWFYSSARNYSDLDAPLNISFL